MPTEAQRTPMVLRAYEALDPKDREMIDNLATLLEFNFKYRNDHGPRASVSFGRSQALELLWALGVWDCTNPELARATWVKSREKWGTYREKDSEETNILPLQTPEEMERRPRKNVLL